LFELIIVSLVSFQHSCRQYNWR